MASFKSVAASTSAGEEDWEDYIQGGYHPVHIGDTYGENERYVVVRKLGWGHFSTVWLARDTREDRHVALKVVKSAQRYTETALDEIKLLERIIDADPNHPGRDHIIGFFDHFMHQGPNGVHVCMVFEVLGENLLGLIKQYRRKGVPIPLVKQIAKQMLQGLDYMHRDCGIIHTDLKPENVLIVLENPEAIIQSELEADKAHLVGVPPSRGRGGNQTPRSAGFMCRSQPLPSPSSSFGSSSLDKFSFGMSRIQNTDTVTEKMSNLDISATFSTKTPSKAPSGPSLLSQQAPSALAAANPQHLPSPAASSLSSSVPHTSRSSSLDTPVTSLRVKIADLGNATWVDHHFTEDIQTRQYRAPEVIVGSSWGPSADIFSLACLLFELLTGGDFLFDPTSGATFTKDDDHIAQMIELMGSFPADVASRGSRGREFFCSRNGVGAMRRIDKLRLWPLDAVLREKYLMSKEDVDAIAGFLNPMLVLHPDRRANAHTMLKHPFLAESVEYERVVDEDDPLPVRKELSLSTPPPEPFQLLV